MTTAICRYRVQNIPDDLKALNHWVVFALEGGKSGKPNKVPYTPGTSVKARSNDASTWRTFDIALAAAERSDLYLGFAFTPELGLTFVDLDDVLGAGGALKRHAQLVVDTLDSYTEASLNGGVHVFARGRPPENFTTEKIDGKVEVYPQVGGRFCLITGDTRPGLGSLDGWIEERSTELAGLFPPREPAKSASNGAHADNLSDEELAAVVAVLREYRTPGQMHHLDLGIGGMLAKSGAPLEQALTIIGKLSGGEEKAEQAIRDSYKKVSGNGAVRGYRQLEDIDLPASALDAVSAALRRVWESGQPRIITPGRNARLLTAQNVENVSGIDQWPAPPSEVYHGWFGGYLELVSETTEAPDQFHLAAALTIIGAYAGRNVHVRHASIRVYPNLYTVLVGLSSESKKDTAIARAWEMVIDPPWSRTRTALPYAERNSVASAESFIKGLSQTSNVIVRMSEFSEILANARRKGTTTILTMLMKAWDTPNQLSNDSITNAATAINPYVSILAGTQPDVLAGDLIGTDITSGFANRVLFVPGSGKGRMPRPPEVDERALHEHWIKAKANIQKYGIDQRLDIVWDDHAKELWDHFYLTPRGDSTIERTMSQRHQNMVLKIALIYAMTDGAKAITFEHLSHAIAFMNWEWECVKQLVKGWATSNDNRLAERILAVLRSTGPIKRRDLQRKTSDPRWTPNDFARLIRSMTENGTLGTNDEGLIGIKDD